MLTPALPWLNTLSCHGALCIDMLSVTNPNIVDFQHGEMLSHHEFAGVAQERAVRCSDGQGSHYGRRRALGGGRRAADSTRRQATLLKRCALFSSAGAQDQRTRIYVREYSHPACDLFVRRRCMPWYAVLLRSSFLKQQQRAGTR